MLNFLQASQMSMDNVMLINFPLRALFFRVGQNVLFSVNNFKMFRGSEGTWARKKTSRRCLKIGQRGKDN